MYDVLAENNNVKSLDTTFPMIYEVFILKMLSCNLSFPVNKKKMAEISSVLVTCRSVLRQPTVVETH